MSDKLICLLVEVKSDLARKIASEFSEKIPDGRIAVFRGLCFFHFPPCVLRDLKMALFNSSGFYEIYYLDGEKAHFLEGREVYSSKEREEEILYLSN